MSSLLDDITLADVSQEEAEALLNVILIGPCWAQAQREANARWPKKEVPELSLWMARRTIELMRSIPDELQ